MVVLKLLPVALMFATPRFTKYVKKKPSSVARVRFNIEQAQIFVNRPLPIQRLEFVSNSIRARVVVLANPTLRTNQSHSTRVHAAGNMAWLTRKPTREKEFETAIIASSIRCFVARGQCSCRALHF